MRPLCLIAILALAVLKARATTNEIPFEYREGLLWIKATIQPSADSLNFLLDTGAGVTVLNTATADRLQLPHGQPIVVQGVGTSLRGYVLKSLSLNADGTPLTAPALAVDLVKFSGSCAQPVDGILGADFFRSRIVQIDFNTHSLRILAGSPDARHVDSLPLQFRPCGMRVPISVNGRKSQWVRLDTGCASPLQWVNSHVRPESCARKAAIGLAEISIPQTTTTVQIGFQNFENVPTGIHNKPIFMGEAGLLGNGLLSCFSSITIDAKFGHLILDGRTATP